MGFSRLPTLLDAIPKSFTRNSGVVRSPDSFHYLWKDLERRFHFFCGIRWSQRETDEGPGFCHGVTHRQQNVRGNQSPRRTG